MHRRIVLVLLLVASCGDDDGGGGALDAAADRDGAPEIDAGPQAPTFEIQTDEGMVNGFTEIVFCFYFRPPDDGDFRIRSIRSRATGPVADLTVFSTQQDVMPPGTLSAVNCQWVQNLAVPGRWLYTSYAAEDEYTFPADDGTGQPVGFVLPAGSAAYVRIHLLNLADDPATFQVELEFEGHPADAEITTADSLLAHATDIEIMSMTTGQSIHSCPMPPGIQFTSLTTFSHKQSVHTFLFDTAVTVFESTMFANPGATRADAPPFIALAGDVLTYRCDYDNPTNRIINDGDNPAVDENCIALGYLFPADAPIECANDTRL